MRNNVKFKIINTLLAFLLSITIFLLSACLSIYLSAFDRDKLLGEFVSSDYLSESYEDFMFRMEALATPSYIEKSCYEDVFTKEKFKSDSVAYFETTLNTGSVYDLDDDVAEVRDKLESNLINYGISNGTEMTDAVKLNIKEFCDLSIKTYKKYVGLDYLRYYTKICDKFGPVIIMAMGIALVVSAIIVLLLIKSYYPKGSFFDSLSYSFLAAALLTAIYPTYSAVTGFYEKINLNPIYLKNVLSNFLINIQNTFFFFCAVLSVLGVLCAVISIIRADKRT